MVWSLRTIPIVLMVAVLQAISIKDLIACTCAEQKDPPCQAYWQASAVFVGFVSSSSTISVQEGDHRYSKHPVRFSVEHGYRGIVGKEIEVLTGTSGADCGYPFRLGERYFVYATMHPQLRKLTTGICGRTRSLDEATEDIDYAASLASAKKGGLLYGIVNKIGRDSEGTPLAGIELTVAPERGSKSTLKTNSAGKFRIAALPSGKYKVSVSLPEELWPTLREQEVLLNDGGCALVHFTGEPNGRITGRVFDVQGLPAPKIEIQIVRKSETNNRTPWPMEHAQTDAMGRYEVKRLPPGEYLIGLRFDGLTSQDRPFPRIYHPGVKDPSQAVVISLDEGEKVTDYDLRLPPLPPERLIQGMIIWPDGRPIPDATVDYAATDFATSYRAKLDAQGRFSFRGYQDLRYVISTSVKSPDGKQVYGTPIEIPVNRNEPVVVVFRPQ